MPAPPRRQPRTSRRRSGRFSPPTFCASRFSPASSAPAHKAVITPSPPGCRPSCASDRGLSVIGSTGYLLVLIAGRDQRLSRRRLAFRPHRPPPPVHPVCDLRLAAGDPLHPAALLERRDAGARLPAWLLCLGRICPASARSSPNFTRRACAAPARALPIMSGAGSARFFPPWWAIFRRPCRWPPRSPSSPSVPMDCCCFGALLLPETRGKELDRRMTTDSTSHLAFATNSAPACPGPDRKSAARPASLCPRARSTAMPMSSACRRRRPSHPTAVTPHRPRPRRNICTCWMPPAWRVACSCRSAFTAPTIR